MNKNINKNKHENNIPITANNEPFSLDFFILTKAIIPKIKPNGAIINANIMESIAKIFIFIFSSNEHPSEEMEY